MRNVFISYKRDGGSGWAEMVRLGLLLYGNGEFNSENLYMDVHSNSQEWHKNIIDLIKKCVNVVVVIHKGFEDSIHEDDDIWLEEIETAYKYKRAIIPFFVDGLEYNDELIKIFNRDRRLSCLNNICKNNQWKTYTHGKCKGSIESLIEAFQDESYTFKGIKFKSMDECFLDIPGQNYIPLNMKCSYDYKLNYSIEEPIIIKAISANSKSKKLVYHLCFEEFANEEFIKNVERFRQSTTERYVLISHKTREISVEWDILSETLYSTNSFNPLSVVTSLNI